MIAETVDAVEVPETVPLPGDKLLVELRALANNPELDARIEALLTRSRALEQRLAEKWPDCSPRQPRPALRVIQGGRAG